MLGATHNRSVYLNVRRLDMYRITKITVINIPVQPGTEKKSVLEASVVVSVCENNDKLTRFNNGISKKKQKKT